jgi:uncharacterized protein (UPF0218 family)
MDRLKEMLESVLTGYAGEALNGYNYLTRSLNHDVFTVISVGDVAGKHVVDTGLVVRLEAGYVVIERDVNDKPLVDALLNAGIPRTQIILAYAGETLRESA